MKLSRPIRARNIALAVLASAAASALPAQAQLGLPGGSLPLPQQVGPVDAGDVRGAIGRPIGAAGGRLGAPLDERFGHELETRLLAPASRMLALPSRLDQAASLLRRHPDRLEADPQGRPAVRAEVLAWSPSAAGLEAARRLGFTIVASEALEGTGESLVTLRVPAGMATAGLLQALRTADPNGIYDFNHVYLRGTSAVSPPAGVPAPARRATAPAGTGAQAPAPRGRTGTRIGLVDGGVEARHPVFAATRLRTHGCDNELRPSEHGTAVAALMVGQSGHFRGVLPQAELLAADVYCDSPTGGSAARIAQALGWLAREQAGVINLSLVGPPNLALERIVARLQQRGHILVAAVGNDGPAAAPLYPASYPGVVGVTAVDAGGKVIPEAARGPQVAFAAPGHQMVSAALGRTPYRQVRGTSFAAPIVAALLARSLATPDPLLAARAVETLMREAAGSVTVPLRNPDTGYGTVGQAFRVAPETLRRP